MMDSKNLFKEYLSVFCMGLAQKEVMYKVHFLPFTAVVDLANIFEKNELMAKLPSNYMDEAIASVAFGILGAAGLMKASESAKRMFMTEIRNLATDDEIKKETNTVNIHGQAFMSVYFSKVIISLTNKEPDLKVIEALKAIINRCIIEIKQNTGPLH